jgi:hypothetical protein
MYAEMITYSTYLHSDLLKINLLKSGESSSNKP